MPLRRRYSSTHETRLLRHSLPRALSLVTLGFVAAHATRACGAEESAAYVSSSVPVCNEEESRQPRPLPHAREVHSLLDPVQGRVDGEASAEPDSEGRTAQAPEHDPRTRQDPDPEVRAAALQRTPPVGTGRDHLTQALRSDPDPSVRAQAARQLAAGDDYASTHALMLALEDDEPQVVQASLAAISDKGDPSVVQELQRVLGDNDDPRLQQQLGETIEHLHSQPRLDPELSDITEYARVTAAHAPREAPTGPHERLEQGSAAQ